MEITINNHRLWKYLWLAVAVAMVAVVTTALTSCRKTVNPTAIQIEDSIRHYPATILGDDLTMVYVVKNIGSDMLVITDVQPAVPTIEADKENATMIPPGKEGRLKFTFHTDKNVGLTRHIIRIFGNILPHGEAQIIFDTHVVRPSIDLSDYEEYYHDHLEQDNGGGTFNERNMDMEYTTGPTSDGRDKNGDRQEETVPDE